MKICDIMGCRIPGRERQLIPEAEMKDKIIEILKQSKNEYLSGELISKELGVTRAAVWKYIKQLQSEGYQIESVTKNGYKLLSCPDLLTNEEIKEGLRTELIGRRIIYYKTVDSTNSKARELAEKGEGEGAVVIAETQTSGRGRTGKRWYSKESKGIWMSLILRPEKAIDSSTLLTSIGCAAVARAIKKQAIEAQIKQPNDIYINGKKVCGLLLELSGEVDRVEYAVLGIGVNVNQNEGDFPAELKGQVTSLRIEAGQNVRRKELLCDILNRFEKMYFSYKESGSCEEAANYCKEHNAEFR